MSEEKKIIALVQPLARKMEHLSSDGRIDLLCALIVQEICLLPPSEREGRLSGVLDALPEFFRVTEATMRDALVQNARNEGEGPADG
jgi:hypothetical protein